MATGKSRPGDRTADEAGWMAAAAADIPIVTQWDDGEHQGAESGTVPTSSASMPSLVASMLDDLQAEPGMRGLEQGTGTGWNAALLSHRLGDANITTVEIDAAVSAQARAALERAGYRPTVVCEDGALGRPPGAPYDRITATYGLREIPRAWIEQTRPGGLILAPFGTHYSNADALVRLTVHGDGTASGPFLQPVEFMKMRSQRLTREPGRWRRCRRERHHRDAARARQVRPVPSPPACACATSSTRSSRTTTVPAPCGSTP